MSGHKPGKLDLINGKPLTVVLLAISLLAYLTVSKGNNMISRKFGVIYTGKFSKTTKLHEPVRQVQFVVFENLQVFITPNCTRNHVVTS